MREPVTVEALLLSRDWRETEAGVEIVLWARTRASPVRARFTGVEPVMFVARELAAHADRRVARALTTPQGAPIDALYFRSQRRMIDERDRLRRLGQDAFESDVKPHERFLMERFITGALRLEGPAEPRKGVIHFVNPAIKTANVEVPLSSL
ncbi:MAG: hypothetical protein ABI551_17630, partial [Polyangiaceae bacterium]